MAFSVDGFGRLTLVTAPDRSSFQMLLEKPEIVHLDELGQSNQAQRMSGPISSPFSVKSQKQRLLDGFYGIYPWPGHIRRGLDVAPLEKAEADRLEHHDPPDG